MHFKSYTHLKSRISEAYKQCYVDDSSIQLIEPTVIITANKIVILSKWLFPSTFTQQRISIRGRRIDLIINKAKNEQLFIQMKKKLVELTGYRVISCLTNLDLNQNEKVDVYCFNQDFSIF